ncbi:MAG: hypothetical protein M3439_13155 [Chloroflexota bacterium]|nr:hypothetical protein [Chloroflexota bacterium]
MEQPDPDAIAADIAHDGLSVSLLGGFSVAVGPHVIAPSAWRLRKAGHLLKLLALAPQHRLRQIIETVNSQLTAHFRIGQHQAHTFWGLCARLYTKLTAHTLCIYLNRLLGKADFLQITTIGPSN